jgi:hypothetical protein
MSDYLIPLGQSFISPGTELITAGFHLDGGPAPGPNLTTITYELREGPTGSGRLLTSTSFELSAPFFGFAEVPMSYTALVPGQAYSFLLNSSSLVWSVSWYQHFGDPTVDFPAGAAIIQGQPWQLADFAFRLSFVPEPSASSLLLTGLVGLLLRRYLRKTLAFF